MLRCNSSCPALDHVGRFVSVRRAFAGWSAAVMIGNTVSLAQTRPGRRGSIIRTCQHKATQQPAQTRTVSNSCSQERVHVCVYSAAWCSTEVDAHGCLLDSRS
mgnify:CR=1 FL=1